ncbi:MAG: hypothetical protein K6F87_00115 [Lachnospiraceae bacterium]|nr:hypothetical protein [Lachnospiraceae bacterium]
MKNRTIRIILGALAASFLISGCSGSKTDTPAEPAQPESNQTEVKADEPEDKDTKKEEKKGATTKVDVTSKRAVTAFLEGTWRMYDPIGETDFATLTIDDVGNITFTRDADNLSAEGTLDVKPRQTYDFEKDVMVDCEEFDSFEMHLYDIPKEFYRSSYFDSASLEEEAGGVLQIARGEGKDRVRLEWLGNGDSFIFHEMFQNHERMDVDGYFQQTWVLEKENETADEGEKEESSDFYGFIWDREKDGALAIQKMTAHKYEAFEEYSNMRYKEGFFTEDEDIGIRMYETVADVDTSDIFYTTQFESAHPYRVYAFTTNEKGRITKISEIRKSYYDLYDFGVLAPIFTYEGTSFTVNSARYDITEYVPAANAIMDMYMIGDWLVIEGHINPHVSAYCLFDIYRGDVSKTIVGANLTWIGDDISTLVYSAYENVYNIKDHIIYTAGTGEIESLEYVKGKNEVRVRTFDDREYTCYPDNDDTATFKLMDFERYMTAERWNEFMKEAPEDAMAYVMIGPPDILRPFLSYLEIDEEVKDDCIYIVSLGDKMEYRIDTGDYDYEADKFKSESRIEEGELNKGGSDAYAMVISEGIPTACVFFADENRGGKFPITMISGETDRCGEFVSASMSAEEARR